MRTRIEVLKKVAGFHARRVYQVGHWERSFLLRRVERNLRLLRRGPMKSVITCLVCLQGAFVFMCSYFF